MPTTLHRLSIVAAALAWLVVACIACSASAGSGTHITFPLPGAKLKSGLRLTMDGRGIDANGYRPIRIEVSQLPAGPFPADRQIRVVLYPNVYSSVNSPDVSQIIELPEGATTVQATIAVPQTVQWNQFGIVTYEGGEKLTDLSQQYLGWTNATYWQWTEASPGILIIDDDVPPRATRDASIRTYQARASDPAPTFDLPDIRTFAWIFPDPNRGNVGWAPAGATVVRGPAAGPQLSDTVLLAQVEQQMSRIEMLPLAELPTRWIDLSQYDIAVISADDLERLATRHPQRLQAVGDWARGGRTLLVYGMGSEFARLPEVEKNLALPPLPARPGQDEAYLGWTLPDPSQHRPTLHSAWDAYQGNYTVRSYSDDAGDVLTVEPGIATPNDLLAAPSTPPFLHRGAGLGAVVALAGNKPFPGDETDWVWVFNCIPANQWTWYQRNGFSMHRENGDYWTFLIPGVGDAPVISFLLLVSLFAAVIGPVNYIFLGKARRLYLLLITVPAGAGLVTAGLFTYALVTDGISVRMRARSFADLDQVTGQAAGWSRQSYYASIAPSRGLEYPEDCTVFGIGPDPINGSAEGSTGEVIRWDGRQKLQRGYISSRTNVQYMVERVTKSEAKLLVRDASPPGQPPQIENRLGADIQYLLLRDRRGNYFDAADLAANAQTKLTKTSALAAEKHFRKIVLDVKPEFPIGYDPTVKRDSLLKQLIPDYRGWMGVDAGSSLPIMGGSLLEANLAAATHPTNRPPLPGTYIAVLKSSPIVPAGVPAPREEASLHVLRGRY